MPLQAPVPNTPALWQTSLRSPQKSDNKYARGYVLVVSGSEFATGAARLAATAALNAGAGVVTLCADAAALRVHAAHVTAIMLREAPTPDAFGALLENHPPDCVVIGPAAGVTASTAKRLGLIARSGLRAVIDADAITVLAGRKAPFPTGKGEWILTPHAGEFERLFRPLLGAAPDLRRADSSDERVDQARRAAELAQSVIILKGAQTVIAAPDGRVAVNMNAGPELATAGSGDVLAGLAAAQLAGGVPTFEAAAAAVWLHGHCAGLYGKGLTADRLVTLVRPVTAFL